MRTVTVKKLDDINSLDNDAFVAGTPEFRIGLMWQLTRAACALNPELGDADRPMQRNITRIFRAGEAKPEDW